MNPITNWLTNYHQIFIRNIDIVIALVLFIVIAGCSFLLGYSIATA